MATAITTTTDNAGWLKMVLLWDWYPIVFDKFPGWEMDGEEPYSEKLIVTNGVGKSSREMAIAFDDVAAGRFYYRDWTDSGLPFVDGGESYRSAFWFQTKADRDKFREMFVPSLTTAGR